MRKFLSQLEIDIRCNDHTKNGNAPAENPMQCSMIDHIQNPIAEKVNNDDTNRDSCHKTNNETNPFAEF